MQRTGSASWRFGHGDQGYLRTALLVRDALQLPAGAADDIPPRLTEDAPDLRDLIPPAEQGTAGQQWADWWRRLVGQAVREAGQRWTSPPSEDFDAIIRHRFAGRDEVFDPPEFESLAAEQPLQSAVRAVCAMRLPEPEQRGHDEKVFAWAIARDVAERTAAELGVPIGDLAGSADVVEVQGLWWYLAGPGSAICSGAAARDPGTAASILREVFRSGVRPDQAA
jgi:hypothetical protein